MQLVNEETYDFARIAGQDVRTAAICLRLDRRPGDQARPTDTAGHDVEAATQGRTMPHPLTSASGPGQFTPRIPGNALVSERWLLGNACPPLHIKAVPNHRFAHMDGVHGMHGVELHDSQADGTV